MKKLKTFGIAALGLSVLSLIGQPILAQGSTSPVSPPANAGKRQPGKRLEELAKKLNLTEVQETKIKGFMKDHAVKAKAIRSDSSLTPDQQKDKLKELRKDMTKSIANILNPEQKEKFKMMHSHHGEKSAKPTT